MASSVASNTALNAVVPETSKITIVNRGKNWYPDRFVSDHTDGTSMSIARAPIRLASASIMRKIDR